MSEWLKLDIENQCPKDGDRVLIQLPATKDYVVAKYSGGAFYDGYMRYCNVEWWQKIETPSPTLAPGDEVIADLGDAGSSHIGIIVRVCSDGYHDVFIVDGLEMVLLLKGKALKPTGATHKDFVDMLHDLCEKAETLEL